MSQETEQKVKIRFKFRSGEEFEAEGNPDFIERQRAQFLYLIGKQPQDAARKENSLQPSKSYYKQPASFATPALPAEALTATHNLCHGPPSTCLSAPYAPTGYRLSRPRLQSGTYLHRNRARNPFMGRTRQNRGKPGYPAEKKPSAHGGNGSFGTYCSR